MARHLPRRPAQRGDGGFRHREGAQRRARESGYDEQGELSAPGEVERGCLPCSTSPAIGDWLLATGAFRPAALAPGRMA
ncbi:hypothetical protein PSAC2689_20440 [Paraburkholderia sacchari]